MGDLTDSMRALADQITKGGRPTHPYQKGLRDGADRIDDLEYENLKLLGRLDELKLRDRIG